jgi:hypothetical protein
MEGMREPAYPAARQAAQLIQPHFARHQAAAPVPEDLEALLDAAFWASLQREEGLAPRISLTLLTPEQTPAPMLFERPIPLAPRSLTRLAPAVVRPGIHLGVRRAGDALEVWGTTRRLPAFTLVLEVVNPGLLVVKHSRPHDSGKFVNVAVIEGDAIKVIDERAATVPDCPAMLGWLVGDAPLFEGPASVLIQLAVSMRAHGRGGSLLVTRAGSIGWRESILQPITYAVQPPYAALAELVRDLPADAEGSRRDSLLHAIDGIAGLTAVDGATIVNDRYELLAFGAKIVRRKGSASVERLVTTEPIEGASQEIVEPSVVGGTRHLSAAQFVHDQRDSLALVASQDGRFTVFAWSPCEDAVHAHRIEALLL